MDATVLLKLLLLSSIMLIVLSVGMATAWQDVLAFVGEPAAAARAMLAMFVVMPLFVLLLVKFAPLKPAVTLALLALAVSPMPPVYPGKASKLGGGQRYVMGLFVVASMVTLVAAPVFLGLDEQVLGIELPFRLQTMMRTLLLTIVIPLAAGLLFARFAPAPAAQWADRVGKLGMIALLAGVVVVLFAAAPAMWSALGDGTLLAIVAMVAVGLLVGHLMGGPKPGNRAALASATALRHPGIALPLAAAAAAPGDVRVVAGTVLLYLLVNVVLGALYAKWAKPDAA